MRFRFLAIIILSISIVFSVHDVNKAKAAAPLLAPAAAIAALEVLIVAVAAAAFIGIISAQQNEQYQAQLNSLVTEISSRTGEALRESLERAAVLLAMTRGDLSPVGVAGAMGRLATCQTGNCNTSTVRQTNASAAASCPGNSVNACCDDFMNRFGQFSSRSGNAVKLFKNAKRNKVLCCFEWDFESSAFEIFDDRGRHLGERSCDDLSDDPCARTQGRGSHAEPNSATHRPRSALCRQ